MGQALESGPWWRADHFAGATLPCAPGQPAQQPSRSRGVGLRSARAATRLQLGSVARVAVRWGVREHYTP